MEDLQLKKAFVITPSDKHYNTDKQTTVTGLSFFLKNILAEL